MLPIPPIVSFFFFIELIGCILYLLFISVLFTCKENFLRNAFYKLFFSTGLAGIGVVSTYWLISLMGYLPVQPDSQFLIYFSQITNGSATFCYTSGKFLIVINRLTVLKNIKNFTKQWSDRKTHILVLCQYIIPLIAHLYFLFDPINWVNGLYAGLNSTTGSIYRGITGIFYGLYVIFGLSLNVIAFYRLNKLVRANTLSSVNFYKQQRSLAIYTLTSTASHTLFALHQFAWSYSFITGDRDILAIVRYIRTYVYDITTFADPIVLLYLSKQVRTALHRRIMGTFTTTSSNQLTLSVNAI